jgi:hypothetical protein
MNKELRDILITAAKTKKPISYGEVMRFLKLDNEIPEHRNVLSKELADVSRYENANNRPLLSSMAMYEGLQSFGKGIYDLAEELGFGKANDLEDILFAFELQKKCIDYWAKGKNEEVNHIPFFTKAELDFFYTWHYKVYDKQNEIHIAAKDFLMETVWSKTAYWASELKKRLDGFDIINWRMWSQPGWDDGPKGKFQVARFKPYTWARIFRKNDDKKDIFFTVGIHAEIKSLLYKIDYFFEDGSSLTEEQKSLCAQLIPDELKWVEIPYEQVEEYNWDLLLEITTQFIKDNTPVYDRIIESVWKNQVPTDILRDKLILRNKPLNGIDKLPEINPSFKGIERDYLAEHEERIMIGTSGEELVIAHERKVLNQLGKPEIAEKVEKVKDGCGYDILSFDEDGNEKYIEVKTTRRGIETPFELSLNEWIFMKKYPNGYLIYRLFNYNQVGNVSEFYILDNPKDQLLFQATSFKAYIKK